MFPLICAWINGWVNNRVAGDLRRHRAHYDVIVMLSGHGAHATQIARFSSAVRSNGVDWISGQLNKHTNDFNQLISANGKMTAVQSMHSTEVNEVVRGILSRFSSHEYSSFVNGIRKASFVYQSFAKCNVYWSYLKWQRRLTHYELLTLHGLAFSEVLLPSQYTNKYWLKRNNFLPCYAPGLFRSIIMMTSSNGNIFRLTGHLCGDFIGHRWIPHTKASDAELWCFLSSAS